ncbi:putative peptidoglycan glycosyltransferase FtsW [Rhodoluna sp.]|uniref:FtsW/RodA/SpoVE family cell cycle protein n=1 Tax=Rhodoluna sp. TaxID=1969481 RepID=UPI0025D19A24|nr:putative peptidoglycan glycosyltransferase FtsW [Rhodoluna sp.]
MSQRLSPAERARLASKPTDIRTKAKKKAPAATSVRSGAAKLSGQGAVRVQHWFDKIFKAQSIHFYQLLGVTLFLVIFGVIMVLSASSVDSLKANNNSFAVAGKQLFFAVLGLLAMSAVSLLPLSFIKSRAKFVFMASMALQIGVLFFGKEINGNRNWIEIFGFTLQPSEFLKIAVILHVSAYLATKVEYFDDRSVWVRALVISGAAMVVVFLGKDLGTVIIMLIAFVGLLALAGMPSKLLNLVGVLLIVLVPIALSIGSSRLGRIMAWLNPNAPDPNDYNWQSEHGMWAISAGRFFGSGLGESKMKWSWIPEVENDFIFAIISEELGLLGALLVIALFVSLAFSFVRILQRTQDYFGKFVVGGVMLWIVFQGLINIAVVLRLLPVLGVPLPLISAGGSSLVATLGAIGVVLAIERENHANPIAAARPVRSRR